jgi:hypothetical protein
MINLIKKTQKLCLFEIVTFWIKTKNPSKMIKIWRFCVLLMNLFWTRKKTENTTFQKSPLWTSFLIEVLCPHREKNNRENQESYQKRQKDLKRGPFDQIPTAMQILVSKRFSNYGKQSSHSWGSWKKGAKTGQGKVKKGQKTSKRGQNGRFWSILGPNRVWRVKSTRFWISRSKIKTRHFWNRPFWHFDRFWSKKTIFGPFSAFFRFKSWGKVV